MKPGEELAGKYRVERVVGAGAMGIVVEAWHIELERQVAVKFLYPEYARNADGAERFRREARAAVRIRNEHVARVLDVGMLADQEIPYIVMEYLEGQDLARELADKGFVPPGDAVRYILEACEAVADAHSQGIVHRDLKPANLFLAEGPYGQRSIKVLDFGISKVSGQGPQQFSLTDTATLMGSPGYMSPEQLESSRNVDERADIWSLGVILHELIVGALPFQGESVPQLVRSILSGTREPLTARDASLSGLELVVARCLCQDRNDRYSSVTSLSHALRPFATQLIHADVASVRDEPLSREVSLATHGGNVRGALALGPSVPSGQAPGTLPHATPGAAAHGAPESPHGSRALASDGVGADGGSQASPARRSEPGGAGVISAWGNTQRARRVAWRRPGAVAAGLLAIGAYFAYRAWSDSPPPSATNQASRAGVSAGAALPPLEQAQVAGLAPTAPPPPVAPSSSAEQPRAPAATPAASARAGAPERALPQPPTQNGVRADSVSVVSSAAASKTAAVSKPSVAAESAATAPRPAPAVASAPAIEAEAAGSKPGPAAGVSERQESDKPKPEPSRRGGFELPDYGGRE